MTEARKGQLLRVGVLVLLFLCLADIASYFIFGHLSDWLMWLIFAMITIGILSTGLKSTIFALRNVGVAMLALALFDWLSYDGPNWVMTVSIAAVLLMLALVLQLLLIQQRRRAKP